MTQISKLLGSDAPNQTRLACMRQTLDEKLSTIKPLAAEIIELLEGDAIVEDIEQADGFKENVYSSLLPIDKLMKKRKVQNSEECDHRLHASHSRVKLPKLQLLPFSGDLTQWPSFWDSFASAIHANEQLTAIGKFNYLNSLLERSGKEAISGYALTATNYQEAVATLQKRFGNKQLIIDKHLDFMFNADPVSNDSNVCRLRCLFDTITLHIRSLQSLEFPQAAYANTFCPKLLTKLPHELRLIVNRRVMLRTIEEELNARE